MKSQNCHRRQEKIHFMFHKKSLFSIHFVPRLQEKSWHFSSFLMRKQPCLDCLTARTSPGPSLSPGWHKDISNKQSGYVSCHWSCSTARRMDGTSRADLCHKSNASSDNFMTSDESGNKEVRDGLEWGRVKWGKGKQRYRHVVQRDGGCCQAYIIDPHPHTHTWMDRGR